MAFCTWQSIHSLLVASSSSSGCCCSAWRMCRIFTICSIAYNCTYVQLMRDAFICHIGCALSQKKNHNAYVRCDIHVNARGGSLVTSRGALLQLQACRLWVVEQRLQSDASSYQLSRRIYGNIVGVSDCRFITTVNKRKKFLFRSQSFSAHDCTHDRRF